MKNKPYSRQNFFDAARRRVREARSLLDYPNGQKGRDGAVTMALLATECALKAALMHGFNLNTTAEADETQSNRWFKGARGHDLHMLWGEQAPNIRVQADGSQFGAISTLHKADRYAYRYGQKKPVREHAEPFVEASELIVKWMEKVMGFSS